MTRLLQTQIALLLAALGLLATPVRASQYEIGLDAGYFGMSASKSAKAVFGSASSITGGVSLGRPIGHSFFARLGGRFVQRSGERVFVADAASPVFALGHPLTMRLIPVYLLAGYRFRPEAKVVPYAGAGVGVTFYRERSVVANEETIESQTKAGLHLAAGVDVRRGSLRFGAEIMYTLVPNALGVGGVSAVYGEKDLGGLAAVARISFNP